MRASSFVPFGTAIPGLVAGWQVKLPVAVALTAVVEALERLAAMYGRLLDGDGILVAACVGLFLLDALTGLLASVKRGDRVTSKAFRRSGWKAIEYVAIGAATTIVSNASAHTFMAFALTWWDEAWLVYVAVTEGFSVFENMSGSREGALLRIRQITRMWQGRDGSFNVEELLTATVSAPVPATVPASPPADVSADTFAAAPPAL